MSVNLQTALKNFNFATVMNIAVMKLSEGSYGGVVGSNIENTGCFLNTLTVSSITESGPKKEFKIGLNNFPAIRCGKTVTIEIQDALGKLDTLQNFFNFKTPAPFNDTQRLDYIYSSVEFSEPLALLGQVKLINDTMTTEDVWLFIPCFVPNGAIKITQDIESSFGLFDLSGTIYPTKIKYGPETEPHTEYYSLHAANPMDGIATINDGDEAIVLSMLDRAVNAIMVGDDVRILDGTEIEPLWN